MSSQEKQQASKQAQSAGPVDDDARGESEEPEQQGQQEVVPEIGLD